MLGNREGGSTTNPVLIIPYWTTQNDQLNYSVSSHTHIRKVHERICRNSNLGPLIHKPRTLSTERNYTFLKVVNREVLGKNKIYKLPFIDLGKAYDRISPVASLWDSWSERQANESHIKHVWGCEMNVEGSWCLKCGFRSEGGTEAGLCKCSHSRLTFS